MGGNGEFQWPYGARAAVSLCFDDARASQLDGGLDIINAHKIRATFYLLMEGMWKRQEDWRRVVEQGHEIGNHTVAHPCSVNYPFSRLHPLEEYSLDMMEDEIYNANHQIHSCLGVKPVTFAYPCGQSFVGRGEDVKSYVPLIARYFLAGRSAEGGSFNDPERCDLAHLASVNIDNMSAEALRKLVEDGASHGVWMVFFAHAIGDMDFQGIKQRDLEDLCGFLKDSRNMIWVDTVASVAGWIRDERGSSIDFARI